MYIQAGIYTYLHVYTSPLYIHAGIHAYMHAFHVALDCISVKNWPIFT